MKNSNRLRGIQKVQLSALILLCLIGGVACGGSGSSTPSANTSTQPQGIASGGAVTQGQDVVVPVVTAVAQQKSVGPRKGVCWNGRTQLREANRQRLRNNADRSCGAVDYQRKLNLLLVAN